MKKTINLEYSKDAKMEDHGDRLYVQFIILGGEYFFGDIFHKKGKIKTIELSPLSLMNDDPGYPDMKYQEKKYNFNKKLLTKLLGEGEKVKDSATEKDTILWKLDDCDVSIFKIIKGYDAGTAGDILIKNKRKK